MADQQRLNRIEGALSQLFNSLLPVDPTRVDSPSTLHWLDELVQNAVVSVHNGIDDIPPDVNSAQDFIKRKLLRENASPEKAARFSNLYSRLLAMPVLTQKWRILYLLYSLSENNMAVNGSRSPINNIDPRNSFENRVYPQYDERPDSNQSDPYSRRESVEARAMLISPKRNPVQQTLKDHNSSREERAKSTDPATTIVGNSAPDPLPPSELDLLRDLPFNLQGVSSNSYQFTSPNAVKLPTNLPVPILSLLNTLAEPCLLYRTLMNFVHAQDGGLINQSLRAAISEELRSYLSLVSSLESEIRRALTAVEKGEDNKKSVRAAGVTLKRCVIWTRDATMGLRLMALIVEQSQQKKGGKIITLTHNFLSSHGDPFVAGFAERILAHVARPFYDMLRHWIYDGELVDPYHEFFVVESDPESKADIDPKRVAMSVWQDKYKLEADIIPSIMSPDFAKKVFLIGKSLNFIRHSCGDSDWVNQYSQTHSKPLDYGNASDLSTSVDTAYQTTMSRLTYLMSTKFLLFTHLKALKQYLLLGQGDFIELLVESLASDLDRPAHSQYRHTLTSQLEHAIRHSNAQYDNPEVLGRLDARMIELARGDTGWDCFTLEYKISPPCDVVITQWANTQYLKIFNVMLRVKRVEYSLNATWRKCMTGARGVLTTVDDRLAKDWKTARCLIAEMVHFVNQLQYYILFEVVEASWETLQAALHKEDATLDDLIEAHTKYIETIVQKGLLASTAERENGFLVQLHNMLKCMLSYREVIESLYSFSVAEYTRKQQLTAKIERRTAAGKWGITEKDFSNTSRSSTPATATTTKGRHDRSSGISIMDEHLDNADSPHIPILLPSTAGDDATLLASLRKRMADVAADFKTRINNFLYDLAHQSDVDLRFLGVVMNFNEAYKPVNPKRVLRRERARRDLQAATAAQRRSHEVSATAASSNGPQLSSEVDKREISKTD